MADLRWDRRGPGPGGPPGGWTAAPGAFTPWIVDARTFRLELRPTTSGELGCYPEQAAVWAVVAAEVAAGSSVLNLFAHTGGTTLAAAAAGAAVTHVDAARTAVGWARRNAALSGLAASPVRWIVDDATAFAAREARRGRAYDVVVMDPPAYGHGTGGQRWHLAADLPVLLEACRRLGVPGHPPLLVLTSHSASPGPGELAGLVGAVWGRAARPEVTPLRLVAADGRDLQAGSMIVARP